MSATVWDLPKLGFTSTNLFQLAYAGPGDALVIDGQFGPKTSAALTWCLDNGGKISSHFKASEFACHCGGRLPGCKKTWIRRHAIIGAELVRSNFAPSGLRIISGYRCDEQNKRVYGGMQTNSQHRWGAAIDVDHVAYPRDVEKLNWFSGIGYGSESGKVTHLDLRHESGHNFTHSLPSSPALFVDGR